jgi:DNA-binding MarR family transcriptional regulator
VDALQRKRELGLERKIRAKERAKQAQVDAALRKARAKDRKAPVGVAAQEAWRLIVSLMFSDLMHDRMHAACDAVDLSPGLAKALHSLEPGQPRPMGELAGGWRCDASYATSIVDGLESRGLVERQILPTDRRVRTVVLTPAGEAAKEQWNEALSVPPEGFEELTGTDARELRDLLRRVVAGGLRRVADRLDDR